MESAGIRIFFIILGMNYASSLRIPSPSRTGPSKFFALFSGVSSSRINQCTNSKMSSFSSSFSSTFSYSRRISYLKEKLSNAINYEFKSDKAYCFHALESISCVNVPHQHI